MCELTLSAANLRVYTVVVRARTTTGLCVSATFQCTVENSAQAFHEGVKRAQSAGEEIRHISITTRFLRA